ncbi:MAG: glutamate racemase [Candidatus Yanofskybacteria bacterium RIFCSPHIGHO2_02_FULL_43_15c]|uniref:Glutamate racemase n=1 Tax=Candidatus Yanofskybacteria bacterium RIFCSPHIGHO2_02_FULL_43_15c TaxID=1802679 RepID=A0A1F8FDU5_9BACT|nr:MAG: glutamate racemase [Candidatus Yanofskybacteria bacterium RIFCSPHIGHO2_02_FULL_43_15c]
MSNLPIGIFDSGVGGLSVLKELQNLLPNENYIFFADQKNVPYGEKTKEELVSLTSRIVSFLISQKAKMIVVACNTATCYAIEELRTIAKLPVVGVVPAIKPAAEQTKTGRIALLATPATAQGSYVTKLIDEFASPNHVGVLRVGCAGLEECVENGHLNSEAVIKVLNSYLLPLKQAGIDQLVLGCTHYPFLRENMAAMLGPAINILDSGKKVAERVKFLLNKYSLYSGGAKGENIFFTNKNASKFSRVASNLLGYKVHGRLVSL